MSSELLVAFAEFVLSALLGALVGSDADCGAVTGKPLKVAGAGPGHSQKK